MSLCLILRILRAVVEVVKYAHQIYKISDKTNMIGTRPQAQVAQATTKILQDRWPIGYIHGSPRTLEHVKDKYYKTIGKDVRAKLNKEFKKVKAAGLTDQEQRQETQLRSKFAELRFAYDQVLCEQQRETKKDIAAKKAKLVADTDEANDTDKKAAKKPASISKAAPKKTGRKAAK